MPSPTRPGGRREYLRRKLFGGNFWGRLNTRIVGQMYVDRGSDPSGTVLLAGSARAGTTWISDILNYRNEYRYIFEPFHPNRLATTRGFRPRQYLRPDNDDPAYLLPATDILSGRVRSVWTDKYNRKRVASRRLVKEVRGNLLLGWISSQFPQVPIILLLRHPCAVVNSQLDLKWNWHLDLRDLLSQSPLMEDHLEPFRDLMTSTTERFDQHVLLWCIENYVPLRQFRPGDVHVAFYEHFCVDPAREIERMFSFLGKPFDPAAMANLSKPSAVSRKTSAIVSGESLVESWRKKVGDAQVARAEEILGAFGLDRIYGADPLPKLAAASGALSGEVSR